jgi:hypothetical protein
VFWRTQRNFQFYMAILATIIHVASRTSLQDRINVGNTKAAETQNRQRLTHLKEKALKD